MRVPPAILLAHGEEDPLIPAEALFLSINLLGEMSIPAQWHLSAGLEHGIDNAGLFHGGLFLAQEFWRARGFWTNRALEACLVAVCEARPSFSG